MPSPSGERTPRKPRRALAPLLMSNVGQREASIMAAIRSRRTICCSRRPSRPATWRRRHSIARLAGVPLTFASSNQVRSWRLGAWTRPCWQSWFTISFPAPGSAKHSRGRGSWPYATPWAEPRVAPSRSSPPAAGNSWKARSCPSMTRPRRCSRPLPAPRSSSRTWRPLRNASCVRADVARFFHRADSRELVALQRRVIVAFAQPAFVRRARRTIDIPTAT